MPIADERSEVLGRAAKNSLENPFPLKGKMGRFPARILAPFLSHISLGEACQPSPGVQAVVPKHQRFPGLRKQDLVSLSAASLWKECLSTDVGNAVAACGRPLIVLLR